MSCRLHTLPRLCPDICLPIKLPFITIFGYNALLTTLQPHPSSSFAVTAPFVFSLFDLSNLAVQGNQQMARLWENACMVETRGNIMRRKKCLGCLISAGPCQWGPLWVFQGGLIGSIRVSLPSLVQPLSSAQYVGLPLCDLVRGWLLGDSSF